MINLKKYKDRKSELLSPSGAMQDFGRKWAESETQQVFCGRRRANGKKKRKKIARDYSFSHASDLMTFLLFMSISLRHPRWSRATARGDGVFNASLSPSLAFVGIASFF